MAVFIKEDSAKLLKKEVPLNPKLTTLMAQKANYYGEVAPQLKGTKRAKKIANAAEKIKYNTNADKFNPSSDAVTLNANEIKRWANALKHLPKNSEAFDANGGETGKEMVDDLLKQIRRNNQKVPMIEPVDKLVKDVKVSDSKLKPTKIGNSELYIESKPKKIYINENKLSLLKEIYNQLTIPFDDKYHNVNGQNIPMKKDYEYFIDWIEEIGTKGKLQGSSYKLPTDIIDELLNNSKYFEQLKNMVLDNLCDNGCVDEIILDSYKKLCDLQNYYEFDFFNIPIEEIEENIENIAYEEDIEGFTSLLTTKGYETFEGMLDDFIKRKLNDQRFLYYIDDKCVDGLLYVERVIKIPSIFDYSDDFDEEDFFQYLNKTYNSVGECWTWSEGEGNSYNSNGLGEDITLKGWVKIEDVDWKETIFLNAYTLNHEKEIRMNDSAVVQLDEITWYDLHLPLDGSYIVPAHTTHYNNSNNINV